MKKISEKATNLAMDYIREQLEDPDAQLVMEQIDDSNLSCMVNSEKGICFIKITFEEDDNFFRILNIADL